MKYTFNQSLMTDQIIKFIKVLTLRLKLNVIRCKKAAVVMVFYCNNFTARFTCLAIYCLRDWSKRIGGCGGEAHQFKGHPVFFDPFTPEGSPFDE